MIKRVNENISNHINKNQGLLKHIILIGITSGISTIFTLFFQMYMGRKLGPSIYGELISLMAILFIILTGFSVIHTILTKFFSEFKAKKQYKKIGYLFTATLRYLFFSGVWGFVVIVSLSYFIALFLKLSSVVPVVIFGLIFWVGFLTPVKVGILRGLQKFFVLGTSDILEGSFRLLIGVILVSIGFGINGALIAIFFGILISVLFGINSVKYLFGLKKERVFFQDIYRYAMPAFFALISIAIMANIDILLVKYFFDSVNAGFYAAASVLATLPFFVSNSFAAIMFPKVSELHNNKKDTRSSLRHSFAYTLIVVIGVLIILFLFPNFIVNIIFGEQYKINGLAGLLALPFGALSLSNILVTYNLAIGRKRFLFLLPLFLFLEVLLISLFHKTLYQVALVLIILLVPLFFILLLFSKREFRR